MILFCNQLCWVYFSKPHAVISQLILKRILMLPNSLKVALYFLPDKENLQSRSIIYNSIIFYCSFRSHIWITFSIQLHFSSYIIFPSCPVFALYQVVTVNIKLSTGSFAGTCFSIKSPATLNNDSNPKYTNFCWFQTKLNEVKTVNQANDLDVELCFLGNGAGLWLDFGFINNWT